MEIAMNAARGQRKTELPRSRVGKRSLTIWLNEAEAIRVKKLAIDYNTSINAIFESVMPRVFEMYPEKPAA